MRLDESATRIDTAMLAVLEGYVRDEPEEADDLLGRAYRSEDAATMLHLLEVRFGKADSAIRELYDANAIYYMDRIGNLHRGGSDKGRYVGSLDF